MTNDEKKAIISGYNGLRFRGTSCGMDFSDRVFHLSSNFTNWDKVLILKNKVGFVVKTLSGSVGEYWEAI